MIDNEKGAIMKNIDKESAEKASHSLKFALDDLTALSKTEDVLLFELVLPMIEQTRNLLIKTERIASILSQRG